LSFFAVGCKGAFVIGLAGSRAVRKARRLNRFVAFGPLPESGLIRSAEERNGELFA